MQLLKSQKNKLFDTIISKGLSPNQFILRERIDVSLIYKAEQRYKFDISQLSDNSYNVNFSPAEKYYNDEFRLFNWYQVPIALGNWISYVKREAQEEDKWEQMETVIQEAHLSVIYDDNRKFTVQEYVLLEKKIIELKASILTLEFLPKQIDAINSKLDQVLKLAIDLNKFDWQSLFVGTIVNIIIQLGLTPSNAHALWLLIKNAFNGVILLG
ncbi:MAG: hypothetical protein JSS96_01130 [Bacteroidetes bacterium]|nr:hypothetical protein [Bacteroidota bacterium]